ncbi:hypothetical protein FJZ31_34480 [Candidatus Poribacteria bacterium]|nr:hypothetical protein [Candidatus Poribacteria bacterium]
MNQNIITLVQNGNAHATVVLAPDIGQHATEAVNDMARVLEKMSGAKLPVVTDGNIQRIGPEIHIGATAFVREQGLLSDNLPVNGYRISIIETESIPHLVITANTSLGISHGIYDLLTNELGVLWGMADALFEEVPERRTVTINPIGRTEPPPCSPPVRGG